MMGDSTLDNIVWVKKADHCIKNLLEKALPDAEIINYAADGFTSHDMLSGAIPYISWDARTDGGDPYPLPSP